jgi:hypothetical protein
MNTLAPVTSALLLATPLVTVSYIVQCVLWPYRACRRCGGFGQFHGPFGGIRECHHCDGTGLRLRLGRRLWNAITRMYRDH